MSNAYAHGALVNPRSIEVEDDATRDLLTLPSL